MFCHGPSAEKVCSKLKKEDGLTTHEIALARCDCLMDRYLRWKLRDRCYCYLAQGVALIFTAITPVVLLLFSRYDGKVVGAATSAIATIATGFLAFTGWREDYIRYGYTFHSLQTEKYRYLTRATKEYQVRNREKAARIFAKRIENLVMAEVVDWRAEMKRIEQEGRQGDRA